MNKGNQKRGQLNYVLKLTNAQSEKLSLSDFTRREYSKESYQRILIRWQKKRVRKKREEKEKTKRESGEKKEESKKTD